MNTMAVICITIALLMVVPILTLGIVCPGDGLLFGKRQNKQLENNAEVTLEGAASVEEVMTSIPVTRNPARFHVSPVTVKVHQSLTSEAI